MTSFQHVSRRAGAAVAAMLVAVPAALMFVAVPAALVLVAAPAALASESFDFEQRIHFEPGTYVKDHTLIDDGGEAHLFYIIGNLNEGWSDPGNEIDFGHATSDDLVHWTVHPRVLSIDVDTWKNRNLWAPHVVKNGNAFVMAYTGVDSSVTQAIGIASSDDLFSWTDFSIETAAYSPDTTWALWVPGTWSNCRDSYIRRRAADDWIMISTAQTRTEYAGAELGALALAFSTDGVTWLDAGAPLAINNSARVLESPYIHSLRDEHYLLFTESGVSGVQVTSSADLLSGWDVTTTDILDSIGFAAEIVEFDGTTYFSRVRGFEHPGGALGRAAVFDTLIVNDGELDYGTTNNLWNDWYVHQIFGSAFSFQPTFSDRPFGRTGVESGVEGHYWINTAEQYQGPMGVVCSECPPFEVRTGVLRSRVFTLTGDAIELLVGGGNQPGLLYVALLRAADEAVLFEETGEDADLMSLRQWDISGLAGTDVFFEIADLAIDGHINVDSIRELGTVGVPEPEPAPLQPGLRAVSNPARMPTVGYHLGQATQVHLAVYDIAGRQVRVLVDGHQPGGDHSYQWDGRTDSGAHAAAGVYFVRLEAGTVAHTARVTRLR